MKAPKILTMMFQKKAFFCQRSLNSKVLKMTCLIKDSEYCQKNFSDSNPIAVCFEKTKLKDDPLLI